MKFIAQTLIRPLAAKYAKFGQLSLSVRLAEIAVDQIRTISKSRLKQKIDRLSEEEAAELRRLITAMYGERSSNG
jgi:mRNA interferase MazF